MRAAGFGLLLGTLLVSGCGNEPPRVAPPPAAVIVAPVAQEDIVSENSFTGRIEAIDRAQVRARVQGFLVKRPFVEGANVKKDQTLFEIDRKPFEIAVEQAQANLANADAALQLATLNFERQNELFDRNSAAISRAQLDQARANLGHAQAQRQARKADLDNAQVNLGYTNITAPFDGRVGRAAYSVGDLVGPSTNPLVTIVSQDPIYVTFPVAQRILLEVRKSSSDRDSFMAKLKLADGSTYGQVGELRFSEVQANASTDTVTVRASIPNPQGLLVDQQLVDVIIVRKKPELKLTMPQSALLLDQQGSFVLAVGQDNKVSQKRITTGPQIGPRIVVEQGLSEGERVIVSGHQKARPGAVVVPETSSADPDPSKMPKKPSDVPADPAAK